MRPSCGRRRFSDDIHLRHDLDARDDRRQQSFRWTVPLHQDSIYAVAHTDMVSNGFDVNVAGPKTHRLLNDQVDEFDHRGVAVHHGRGNGSGSFGLRGVNRGVGEFLQHRVHRLGFALPVITVDRFDDLFARSQHRQNVFVQDELQLLNGVNVHGVAHDHLERPVFLRQRQNNVFPRHRFGHQLNDRRRNAHLVQIHGL
jgi:hypothetical protein